MKPTAAYYEAVNGILQRIVAEEADNIRKAAVVARGYPYRPARAGRRRAPGPAGHRSESLGEFHGRGGFRDQCPAGGTAAALAERGIEPPIWKSGNMPGGDEHGEVFIRKNIPRIKHLL